ncbi:MAG: aminoglycoside phosphotransferase family protein [Planctomycetes bacterium]|nr:aminoglycoside phosphotransferase family protein [Planctomycetota bacterium]
MNAVLELANWYPAFTASAKRLRVGPHDDAPAADEVLVSVDRRRPTERPGLAVRRFACYPGTGGGFVLLDADSARVFRAGAALLPGGRALTRCARSVVRASSHVGLQAWLAPRRLAFAETAPDPELALERRFSGLPAGLAWNVASSVPGRDRKTIVQLVARTGAVIAFAKLGERPHARARVEHEARTLATLARHGCAAPRLLGCEIRDRSALLVQTALAGERGAPRLGAEHERFLSALLHATGTRCPLSGLPSHRAALARLDELSGRQAAGRVDPHWLALARELALRLAEAGAARALDCGFAHGDFTPWNVCVANGTLAAFDWELARELAPRGFDAFHHVLQQSVLVERLPPDALLARLGEETPRFVGAGPADDAWWLAFGAYLLDVSTESERIELDERSPFVQVEWSRRARIELLCATVERLGRVEVRAA